MSDPQPIIFRIEITDGGDRVVYAVMDWPEITTIATDLLDGIAEPEITTNEHGEIIITVANGTAVYNRAKQQTNPNYVTCELCSSSWSPVPLLERVAP